MYESKSEKHGAGGRDPRGSAKKEDDFKWNERRWTGEEDRVEEWRTKLQEETKRLEKQNTVASENPSLEGPKSKVTSIRTGSLNSYGDSKLRSTPNKRGESLYENNILEGDQIEDEKDDSGKNPKHGGTPAVPTENEEVPTMEENTSTKQATPVKCGSRSSLLPAGEVSTSPKQLKAAKPGLRSSLKSLWGVKPMGSRMEDEPSQTPPTTPISSEWRDAQRDKRKTKRDKIAYFEGKAAPKK